jgi:hypothetical protein
VTSSTGNEGDDARPLPKMRGFEGVDNPLRATKPGRAGIGSGEISELAINATLGTHVKLIISDAGLAWV